MALPEFPTEVKRTLYFYLYLSDASGHLTMFETKVNDPQWLFIFSTEIIIPVPKLTDAQLYSNIEKHFRAVKDMVNAEAATKLHAIDKLHQQLLALEN